MKSNLNAILAAALFAASLSSIAQQAQPTRLAQTAAAGLTDAEVRKVDKSAGKITLKHGEIKSLDMPPMTMVFVVNDPAMLDQVKAGDKIRFAATSQDGKMTVTEIQAAK